MTAAEVVAAAIRKEHPKVVGSVDDFCSTCDATYPCLYARAADLLIELNGGAA